MDLYRKIKFYVGWIFGVCWANTKLYWPYWILYGLILGLIFAVNIVGYVNGRC